MYIYTYTYTYTYPDTYTYKYIHIVLCIYTYDHICIHTYLHMYIDLCFYIHMMHESTAPKAVRPTTPQSRDMAEITESSCPGYWSFSGRFLEQNHRKTIGKP